MSLDPKTTAQVYELITSQLEGAFSRSVRFLPKSFLRVQAKVLAAVYVQLYKYGAFIFLQMFVRTASDKDTEVLGETVNPLKFWGRLIGVGDPKAATAAELEVTVSVLVLDSVLVSGTQLLAPSNGVTYLVVGDVLLNSANVPVRIRAYADQSGGDGSGTVGNLENGDVVDFVSPPVFVASQTVVSDQLVTGAEGESSEAYRQRILDRFQKRPQGGAYADYELWGEEVAGIINVYPYTGDLPGTVELYSEATPESSGNEDGIPTQAQLDAVAASVELDQSGLASRRPAGAFVISNPITRTSFDIQVTGITGVDNLAAVRASITAALEELFLLAEPFIPGLSIPPRRDQISRTRISATVEDIVTAAGGTFTGATFEVTGSGTPLDLYLLGKGEKAKAADVSFL